jgi:hypothetical protein
MANEKKVITLLCERAADLNNLLDGKGEVQGVDGLAVVKLPCSGMIQPLMIEGALKNGAAVRMPDWRLLLPRRQQDDPRAPARRSSADLEEDSRSTPRPGTLAVTFANAEVYL